MAGLGGHARDAGLTALATLLAGPVVPAAQALLGCTLSTPGLATPDDTGPVTVRLTEVEAYGGVGEDPASHAHRGRTARNAVMFGPAGYLYVYFTYGMHWCTNVVCGPSGEAAAVLLRAGEVVAGHATARARRPAARTDRDLARGPARLAQALGIDGACNGTYLCDAAGTVVLAAPDGGAPAPADPQLCHGPRVGVRGGAHTPWRFWLAGERSVSVYRPAARRR